VWDVLDDMGVCGCVRMIGARGLNREKAPGARWMPSSGSARTGAPWRDLPEQLGNWNSVHRQFRRWTASGLNQH
jgi:hypothetical protein